MVFLLRSNLSSARQQPIASAGLLPPGPRLSPENQSRLWLEKPTELLESCHREYGDLFALRLGSFGTLVVAANPKDVRQIFNAPPEWYECRQFNESYRYVMGRNAVFLQDGQSHRRIKRILAPQFRGDRLRAHPAEICRVTRDAISAASAGGVVRLRPLMHEITLRCLLSIVFGERHDAREQVMEWFRSAVWRDLRSWKPWTSLSRLHGQMRNLLSTELDVRRTAGLTHREPDFLDMLLAARDGSGSPLLDEEIQDQVLMLTITAGDAVAVATTWALYCAATHPAVQERIREERNALGASPEPARVAEQPYLTATAQEVLRLYTVLPTVSGRRLTAPRDFFGYLLDAGVMLVPCEYLIHRRADIFEQPLEFRPERFIGHSYAPHEYFPFGGGQRACLGSYIAPLTVKLALATVLSQFRLAPAAAQAPQVVRYGTLLAPTDDLTLQFTPL
jgi:cytochrome P450